MRLGFFPCLRGEGGGVYQYSLSMLRAMRELKEGGRLAEEVVVIAEDVSSPILETVGDWPVRRFAPLEPMHRRWLSGLHALLGNRRYNALQKLFPGSHGAAEPAPADEPVASGKADLDAKGSDPALARWFSKCGADLVLFPFPTAISFESGLPYVMAIHDLQHRLQPEFPEVSEGGEWESREYIFRNGARKATLLLADSEAGKEDILNFYGPYGVAPDRVKVLPFLPASYLAVRVEEEELRRVREAHRLPVRFLFYPAQFWAHKNHELIVEALGLLAKRDGLEIPIVFCGSHSGALREKVLRAVQECARRLGVEGRVLSLGYVPDGDMSALYAGAVALIMPTFFGPTNIPILEAWSLGCPVLTSDIRGVREQAGDAAVLADPRSIESIANGIRRLWTDEGLRATLTKRGRERLQTYTPEDFRARLADILDEAKARVGSEKGR